jgi:DNA repair photolyase
VLRLPWELDSLFREWLSVHYPQRAARVMARVQDLHDLSDAQRGAGKTYDSDFVTRMKGSGCGQTCCASASRLPAAAWG